MVTPTLIPAGHSRSGCLVTSPRSLWAPSEDIRPRQGAHCAPMSICAPIITEEELHAFDTGQLIGNARST